MAVARNTAITDVDGLAQARPGSNSEVNLTKRWRLNIYRGFSGRRSKLSPPQAIEHPGFSLNRRPVKELNSQLIRLLVGDIYVECRANTPRTSPSLMQFQAVFLWMQVTSSQNTSGTVSGFLLLLEIMGRHSVTT